MLISVSCVGAPAQIQEAAALTFGRIFLMPSIRVTPLLGHAGVGVCADNSKVCSIAYLSFRSMRAASGPVTAQRAKLQLQGHGQCILQMHDCKSLECEHADFLEPHRGCSQSSRY